MGLAQEAERVAHVAVLRSHKSVDSWRHDEAEISHRGDIIAVVQKHLTGKDGTTE